MMMETTTTLLRELQEKLREAHKQKMTFKAFAGFDGFVDRIQKVVKKRHVTKTEYFSSITAFAHYLAMLAGKSGQVELITEKTKMGGNAPILSNALARLNVEVTCLGTMGFPEIHRVFEDMHPACHKISVATPGSSNALEFGDGKIIFSVLEELATCDFDRIIRNGGLNKIKKAAQEARLFTLVDWVNLPLATSIWQQFLDKIIKPKQSKDNYFLFDLCDPSKKSRLEIKEVIDLISEYSAYGNVTLGLNENETNKIWLALTGNDEDDIPSLEIAGHFIYKSMHIDTLLIHPIDRTLIFTKNKLTKNKPGTSSTARPQPIVLEMQGHVVTNPKVLTGRG